MKILVVGGGGREHAIIKKLKENREVTELYALPGNGGIAKDAVCVPIGAKEIDGSWRLTWSGRSTMPWLHPTISWCLAPWTP